MPQLTDGGKQDMGSCETEKLKLKSQIVITGRNVSFEISSFKGHLLLPLLPWILLRVHQILKLKKNKNQAMGEFRVVMHSKILLTSWHTDFALYYCPPRLVLLLTFLSNEFLLARSKIIFYTTG